MIRQKVLFFISSLEGGGAERVMVDLLRHIDKSRIEPVLVLLYPFENSPYIEYLPADLKIIPVERKSDGFFEKLIQLCSFLRTVGRERPQVILSMLTHNNIMAILAGLLFRTRVLACEHSTLGEVVKTKDGKKMMGMPTSLLVKALYRFADKVIVVSEGIKTDLAEGFGISPEKIEVVYNPLDMDRIVRPVEEAPVQKDSPVVIAMGRLTPPKGFDVLIRAFGTVVKETDAKLVIIGEGEERRSLERLVSELELTEKISLPGFQKDPYPLLCKADVFVLSSRYEGLPMAILEAMACGLPVVSTDCKSGPREILQDGKSGLLVPVDDEAALAKGIRRLIKDKELRARFSRLSKERAADFSAGRIIKRYEELLAK